MRKAALAALLLVLVPLQARALDTEELLGLVAMPLAVAAASEVTGVPASELSQFVATLNRAQMPPTQFVQVVRYAPAALVLEDQQPAFVEYVATQVDQGVTGPQLVTVIEDRYRAYDLEPQFVAFDGPATTYVVREDYIPEVVVTRVAEMQVQPNDLLALAAMPLAVAAVADITGVPLSDLSDFVATLNAARVPPMQMVEVLRYTPVVFVDQTERPRFVQFVHTQVDDGVTGLRLVDVIDDRFQTYDLEPQFRTVNVIDDEDEFFPAVVTSRVATGRAHPHGGPPGQLKKQRGLQTGADVVQASRRVRTDNDRPRVTRRVRANDDDVRRVVHERPKKQREIKRVAEPRVERVRAAKPRVEQQNRGNGNGNSGRGNGNGGGKGKGKGKG
ncbi:MAG TPA: hypothetical protein VEK11_22840 [Thermoanaerobaculia bacterium]|nr:hypothetical protein [Thermoanaerobaculia bacterium]